MITFIKKPTIIIHTGSITMSKSFVGLHQAVKDSLKREPKKTEIFVFFNKKRDKVKIMFYHVNGFVILYKALDEEHFVLEHKAGVKRVKNINCVKLLEHIDIQNIIG